MLNQRRRDNLKTLLSVQPDSYNGNELSINLDCLVNQTDFIELGTLLRMLEVDLLEECIEKVRNETAIGIENAESVAKIQESINAKYGQNSSESIVKLQQRTAFMRTTLDIKKQTPDLLLALHIFGVKQVYLDVSESFELRR